ncbi:helix-turn-helix domain-containing protein [Streptomyces sp. NPDC048518]|uniref:helix-turn-helix domain-containing protein n=1 Tax=Streptomyces sp. NPDC048518 TaxID=3155029 RepID=UPI0034064109
MTPGEQRLQLVAELDRLDAALRPLVIQAVHAGVPYRRIAELTNISRATVARWGKHAPGA